MVSSAQEPQVRGEVLLMGMGFLPGGKGDKNDENR